MISQLFILIIWSCSIKFVIWFCHSCTVAHLFLEANTHDGQHLNIFVWVPVCVCESKEKAPAAESQAEVITVETIAFQWQIWTCCYSFCSEILIHHKHLEFTSDFELFCCLCHCLTLLKETNTFGFVPEKSEEGNEPESAATQCDLPTAEQEAGTHPLTCFVL